MLKSHRTPVQVTAHQDETQSIKDLERLLASSHSHSRLVGSTGEEILLPESVYTALCQVIHAMASGQSITIIPQNCEMTTQEAADFLNVSRPYLIKLLESGEIPHVKVGTHRRIHSQDIIAYKQQQRAKRRQSLNELTAFLQDEGFYDDKSSKAIL